MNRAQIAATAAATALLASCVQEAPPPAPAAPAPLSAAAAPIAADNAPRPAYRLDIRITLLAPQPTRPNTANFEAEHRTVRQWFETAEQCNAQRVRWARLDQGGLPQQPGQVERELLAVEYAPDAADGYAWVSTGAECTPEPRA